MVVDLDPELARHHRPQQHLGVARHHRRDALCLLLGEAFLCEHERDLGLGLAWPLRDFVTLLVDLRIEDLALALAADVFAGRHREHAGEATGDARDDDRERLAGCTRDRGDDRERRYQSVLEPEDDLADLAEE